MPTAMSAQDPTNQIPPLQEPPLDEPPPAAEEVPSDAERGQRGPASDQTGAEQTGVDASEMLGAGTGPTDGPVKDPDDWVTGDQPATDAQKSYLDSLARQAGEQIPADLTKAEASEHIDRLQGATGRDQQGQTGQTGQQG